MVNQDIVDYISEGKKRGFSVQLLKKKLLEAGFPEMDVDEAAETIEPKQQIQPPLKKIDLFDKSQDKNYRPLPSESASQQNLPWQTKESKPAESVSVDKSIQKKPEVKLDEKKVEDSSIVPSGEAKWMKIAGILGIFILAIHIMGIVLNFVAKDFLMSLIQNNLTLLIIGLLLVLVSAIYYYAFARLGKKTNERMLSIGSWFVIVAIVMYVLLVVVADIFVYQQAINFFSGVEEGGSYKITFLIISILWIVALLLHLVGQILLSIGMIRVGKDVKFLKMAGWLNIFVFLAGIGFLVGMILLIYSILNAFSVGLSEFVGVDSIVGSSGVIAIWSFMTLFGINLVARIFEVLGLFDASKKFE
jgi:hypothetical protein